MIPDVMITTHNALLAFGKLSYPNRYFDYMFAHYVSGQTEDQVWHRSLMMDHEDWIQLRGNPDITAPEAFWNVLGERERPLLPLPAILTAGFLALVSDPKMDSQRDLFYLISSGVTDLLNLLPSVSVRADTDPLSVDQLTQFAQSIIAAILHQEIPIPWPIYDADGFRVLLAVATHLWTFPPDLVNSLVTAQIDAFAAYIATEDADDEDDQLCGLDESPQLTTTALLRNISALRSWLTLPLTVRGLPVQMPGSAYDLTWKQALVLNHPDAPSISDADLEWLCEGTIGNEHQRSQIDFVNIDLCVENLPIHYATRVARITVLQAEVSDTVYIPKGRSAFEVSEPMVVLSALRVYAVRLVAGPTGCWIRLISHPDLWGRVLWWKPEVKPPICLPLLFQTTQMSPGVMALHEALWELWHNLCVQGGL